MRLTTVAERVGSALLRPVAANAGFFAMLWAVGEVCIVFEPWNTSRLLASFQLVFELYLLCLLLLLLPVAVRRWAKWLLALLLYGVALVDAFCYARLGSPLTSTLVAAFAMTDGGEAAEALHAYLGVPLSLSSPLLWLLLLPAFGALWVTVGKRMAGSGGNLMRGHKKFLYIIIIIAAAVLSFGGLLSWNHAKRFYYHAVCGYSERDFADRVDLGLNTYCYVPVFRLADAVAEYRRGIGDMRRLADVADAATVYSCSFRVPDIVLVIGESYNRHHAQVYGYRLPTTPCAARLKEAGSLLCFDNVVASYNFTYESLRNMLSLYAYGSPHPWHHYPLFTTLFMRAGYHVALISNQLVPSADTFSDFGENMLFNSPAMSRNQFHCRNVRRHTYDGGLLADYDSLRCQEGSHNLTIFHLMGQHVEFAGRYPHDTFSLFKPADYDRPDLSGEQRQILADYDNATRYNDAVVCSILDRYRHRDAVAIILADHGESVFDGCGDYGRSMATDRATLRQQYDIPFLVWGSDSFRQHRPQLWQQIAAARHRPLMTDNLAHLMLWLAGVHSPYYIEADNVVSPQYNSRRRRLVQGTTDYDGD